MNPRASRRLFRRIHLLPSLITLGNFACGFLAIILCLNALYFSTRAQILEERATAAAATPAPDALSLPDGIGVDYDHGKARRNALALHSVAGARGRAGFLFHWACLIIFLGMLFDMLDGKVARLMGADSAFGKELDSLADVTTFGIAPAVVVNTLSLAVLPATYAWWSQVIIFGVVFALCAVLRLARYNIQSGTDKNVFSGLPSPAAAGCVVSAVLLFEGDYGFVATLCGWFAGIPFFGTEIVHVKARLLSFFLLLPGLLMVSAIPFTHVANRYLTGKKSFTILVLAVLLIALVWHEPRLMLFLAFNSYMIAGIAAAIRKRLRGEAVPSATPPGGGESGHDTH
ncbi:MAG: CDP-alcohol phosphatidyltransferase family protein [Planctomycetota bacterium]|jgi:CDP-diacylglycerol--serine O-phosphatidyltransferase|nr:CDP-alcohol phosphatidyltransferase family protein [Planctomycetota bacterium]